jgi:hypothetical protein
MSWTDHYSLQTPAELENLLGVGLHSDSAQLRNAYVRQLLSHPHKKKDLRLACKLASDPLYKEAFLHYKNLMALDEAGYFDDGLEPGTLDKFMSPLWFTTPLAKILNNISKLETASRPFAVLVSTGGFAPLHEGHIMMMHIAREKLMDYGYNVVGGFLSPSHDNYVLNKCDSIRHFIAQKRIHLLNHVLKDSDWLGDGSLGSAIYADGYLFYRCGAPAAGIFKNQHSPSFHRCCLRFRK